MITSTLIVILNLTAANIYVLMAWRFKDQRDYGFTNKTYWWSMWLIAFYHSLFAIGVFFDLLGKPYDWKVYENYMHLVLAPLLVPNVLADYTLLPKQPNYLARQLYKISSNAKSFFAAAVCLSALAILTDVLTQRGILPPLLDLGRWIKVDLFLGGIALIWALMEFSGLRATYHNFGGRSKLVRGHRIIMFLAFVYLILDLSPGPHDENIGLLLPFLTLPFVMIIGWRNHRLVFIDLIVRKLVQLAVIVIGCVLTMWVFYTVDIDAVAPLIIIQGVIIIAFFLQLTNRLMNDIWLPGSITRESFNASFPAQLVSCLTPEAAVLKTKSTLSTLFKADIGINENLPNVVDELMIGDGSRVRISLGWVRGFYPWFPDSLQLVRDAGDRLDSHLQLLELQRREHEQSLRHEQLKELTTKAELVALRSQIRPHFLFNVLNTIHSFIAEEPERAEQTLELLAELMRGIVAGGDRDLHPLQRELDLSDVYLQIEEIRFGDRLSYTINCENELGDMEVPVFCVQPLVENAVKYSVEKELNTARVELAVHRCAEQLSIHVDDNGPGLAATAQSEAGLGLALKNIAERLEKLYGAKARLELGASPLGGARATLLIPLEASS